MPENDKEETYVPRRTERNKELYENINNNDLENFNVNSNVSVLNGVANNIDIDQIKSMLDRKYKEEPKRKSINIEETYEEEKKVDEPTKEYDLNSVLEQAREGNKVDYNIERLKKLRMTQYDILKNLNLDNEDEEETVEKGTSEKDLMTLIDIATGNDSSEISDDKEIDPLDILTDLKGSDNTVVYEGINTLVDKDLLSEMDKIKKEETNEVPVESQEKTSKKENILDNSFYTESVNLSEKDFEGFEDLKVDAKGKSVLLWIIVVIVILAFLLGAIFLINNILDLGLF